MVLSSVWERRTPTSPDFKSRASFLIPSREVIFCPTPPAEYERAGSLPQGISQRGMNELNLRASLCAGGQIHTLLHEPFAQRFAFMLRQRRARAVVVAMAMRCHGDDAVVYRCENMAAVGVVAYPRQ